MCTLATMERTELRVLEVQLLVLTLHNNSEVTSLPHYLSQFNHYYKPTMSLNHGGNNHMDDVTSYIYYAGAREMFQGPVAMSVRPIQKFFPILSGVHRLYTGLYVTCGVQCTNRDRSIAQVIILGIMLSCGTESIIKQGRTSTSTLQDLLNEDVVEWLGA